MKQVVQAERQGLQAANLEARSARQHNTFSQSPNATSLHVRHGLEEAKTSFPLPTVLACLRHQSTNNKSSCAVVGREHERGMAQ